MASCSIQRLSKSVQLTKSGRLLLEEIIPILASCEALDTRFRCLEKLAPLHIVSSITIAAFWLPKILKAFEQDLPDIPIHVDVVSAANAIDILREKGSAIRDTLDSVLYLAGHTALPAWTSVNSLALIEAAKAGLGIAILPDVLVNEPLSQGKLISLSVQDLLLENELFAVHHLDKYMTTPFKTLLWHITQNVSLGFG